ncbi:hypothetical protein [Cytobacillus horneckiae]|uniref:hypothetical protein n=1 Tax=Cytobacillus horneckiae TaxID=549687 RepID=UPI003D9A8EFB
MASHEPNFIKSPYFVAEPGNWHLKPGAPAEVVKEFNEFMQEDEAGEPVDIIDLNK